MSVPRTNIHSGRIINQLVQELVNIARDMRSNAAAHKAMAAAQSPPLATLRQFVLDCAASYQSRLQNIASLRADSTRLVLLDAELARRGWTESDIVDVYTPLKAVADGLAGATLATYNAITNACNQVLANVDAPDSLWSE
jgi:hypothetical protein